MGSPRSGRCPGERSGVSASDSTGWHSWAGSLKRLGCTQQQDLEDSLSKGCLPFCWCKESFARANDTLNKLCDGEATPECSWTKPVSFPSGNPSLMQPSVPESPQNSSVWRWIHHPGSSRVPSLWFTSYCWMSAKLSICSSVAAWPKEDLVLSTPFPILCLSV